MLSSVLCLITYLIDANESLSLYIYEYEVNKENGESLFRGNSAQSVPEERGCNPARYSRLHTLLLLLALDVL